MKVYLAGAHSGPVLKIGVSHDPHARMRELWVTGYGGRPYLIETGEAPYAYYAEQAAHALLAESRREGEWFQVTEERARRAVRAAIYLTSKRHRHAVLADDPDAIKLRGSAKEQAETDWHNPAMSGEEVAAKWEVGHRTLYNQFGPRLIPDRSPTRGRRR